MAPLPLLRNHVCKLSRRHFSDKFGSRALWCSGYRTRRVTAPPQPLRFISMVISTVILSLMIIQSIKFSFNRRSGRSMIGMPTSYISIHGHSESLDAVPCHHLCGRRNIRTRRPHVLMYGVSTPPHPHSKATCPTVYDAAVGGPNFIRSTCWAY